ncbi:MAG: hypothetical protein ABW221_21555 [Vicinamibacteria bacterium]
MTRGPRLVYRSQCRPCRVIARLVWLLSLGTFTLVADPDCQEPALEFASRRLTGLALHLLMSGLVLVHLLLVATIGFLLCRAAAER